MVRIYMPTEPTLLDWRKCMLHVKTKLKASNLEGVGLFANELVARGSIVWEASAATLLSYSTAEWSTYLESLNQITADNLIRFAYFTDGFWNINIDDSRFMNHSETPNTSYIDGACYANCDIDIGNELTTNYAEFCQCNDSRICATCMLCSNHSV